MGPRFQEILWSKVSDKSFFRKQKINYVKNCRFLGRRSIPMDTGTFKDSIIVKLFIFIIVIQGVLLNMTVLNYFLQLLTGNLR